MVNDNERATDIDLVDYPRLLDERCRGKKDLAARLLRNLLEDSGPRWLNELDGVVISGDMDGVARIGHSIKGSCKMLYAGLMVRAAISLEDAGKDGLQARVDSAFEELKHAFTETSLWLRKNPQFLD